MTAPDNRSDPIDAACRLIAAGRAMARRLAAVLRGQGLSEAEFRLLWHLRGRSGSYPCPASDQQRLADHLGLSPAQVSSLVERLRAGGNIFPSIPTGDRRRQIWQLTPRGAALVSQIAAAIAASVDAWRKAELEGSFSSEYPGEAA